MGRIESGETEITAELDLAVVDEELEQEAPMRLVNRRYLHQWLPEQEPFPELASILKWPHLHVEVGCGLGRHLLAEAPLRTDTFFLGIERAGVRSRIARHRMNIAGWPNLLIVRRDAIPLVAFNFPDGCVDEYTFYYPDPWPRRRHRHRRWYWHPFITEVLRTLKLHGQLLFTSDEAFYIRDAAWVLSRLGGCEIVHLGRVPTENARTHFEIKYLNHGRVLYEVLLRKSAEPRWPDGVGENF